MNLSAVTEFWHVSKISHLTWLPHGRRNSFRLKLIFGSISSQGCLLFFCANKELLVGGHRQYKMMMWKGGPAHPQQQTFSHFRYSMFDLYQSVLDKHRQKQWGEMSILGRFPKKHNIFCLFQHAVADYYSLPYSTVPKASCPIGGWGHCIRWGLTIAPRATWRW